MGFKPLRQVTIASPPPFFINYFEQSFAVLQVETKQHYQALIVKYAVNI